MNRISSLVCGALRDDKKSECTPFSLRMTDGLIRVAATRIFTTPEQSFLELIVNSVDAYAVRDGGVPVGKFGMGFYSIFYWIYLDRVAEITISTKYKNEKGLLESYDAKFSWSSNGPTMELIDAAPDRELPSLFNIKPGAPVLGTTITVKSNSINRDALSNEIKKLKYLDGVNIMLVRGKKSRFGNDYKINNGDIDQKLEDVMYSIREVSGVTTVKVCDTAIGIPKSLLLNTLLIPSVSSKIRSSPLPLTMTPIINNVSKYTRASFSIVAGGITLYTKSCDYSGKDMVIMFPATVSLPVSRDDIILTPTVMDSFMRQLYNIVNVLIVDVKDVTSIIDAIEQYAIYSPQTNAKVLYNSVIKFISDYPNTIYVKRKSKIEDFCKTHKIATVIHPDPSDYEMELKLTPHLEKLKLTEKHFHMKDIISVKSEPFSLSKYIFVDTTKKGWKENLTISNKTSILFPIIKDEKPLADSSLFDGLNLRKTCTEETRNNVNILHATWEALTQTSDTGDTQYYIEQIIDLVYRLIPDDIDEFLLKFNNRISMIKLNFVYGRKNTIVYDNVYRHGVVNDRQDLSDSLTIPKLTKEGIFYWIDQIIIEVNSSTMWLPNISLYMVCGIDNPYGPLGAEIFSKLNVFIDNTMKQCVTPEERIIANHIIYKIYTNVEDVKMSDVGSYEYHSRVKLLNMYMGGMINNKALPKFIVGEIRRFGGKKIKTYLSNYSTYLVTSASINTYLFKPVMRSIDIFNRSFGGVLQQIEPLVDSYKTVNARKLVSYLYNETEPGTNSLDIMLKASESDYPDAKLETISISVNEGTTKDYGSSVITEMMQNSLDAIRSSGVESEVLIDLFDNGFTVTDSIGIDVKDLIYILVPFVSSKDVTDVNVTGEMGTGFFNVYRYPWCDVVTITTSRNGVQTTIICKPILEDDMVKDISYTFKQIDVDKSKTFTSISVYLCDDRTLRAQVLTDINIYINNYLGYIDSSGIKLNGEDIIQPKTLVWENELGSVYTTSDSSTPSFVMTNGVPFTDLETFVVEYQEYGFAFALMDYATTGVIINLRKTIYTPSQSRTKISLIGRSIREFVIFLNNAAHIAILRKYAAGSYSESNDIVMFSSSTSNVSQLKLSTSVRFDIDNRMVQGGSTYNATKNYLNSSVSGINHLGEYINFKVETFDTREEQQIYIEAIKAKNFSVPTPDNAYGAAFRKWIINKNLVKEIAKDIKIVGKIGRKKSSNTKDTKLDEKEDASVICDELQFLVDSYWETLLENAELIRGGNKLNVSPPKAVFSDISSSSAGYYKRSEHLLVLGIKAVNPDEFVRVINKYILIYRKNKLKAMSEMRTDKIMIKFLSTSLPSTTLLHELLHAVTGTKHDGSSHDSPNFSVDGYNGSFEETAVNLYQLSLKGEFNMIRRTFDRIETNNLKIQTLRDKKKILTIKDFGVDNPKFIMPLTPKFTIPPTPKFTIPPTPKFTIPLTPKFTIPPTPKFTIPLTPKFTIPLTPKFTTSLTPKFTTSLTPKFTTSLTPKFTTPITPLSNPKSTKKDKTYPPLTDRHYGLPGIPRGLEYLHR
jgi:hypothetical protein